MKLVLIIYRSIEFPDPLGYHIFFVFHFFRFPLYLKTRCLFAHSITVSMIPKPSQTEFRRLRHARHETIAQALHMTPTKFEDFKRILYHEIRTKLDRSKPFHEQEHAAWERILQWARKSMPDISKYEDFWPIELFATISLSKGLASKRFRLKRAQGLHNNNVACTEAATVPAPLPMCNMSQMSDNKTNLTASEVQDFLKSCDFNFAHLSTLFTSPRAGLYNLKRLEIFASWPAAPRRDHLERHFGAILDDVEIEALNRRFGEINDARHLE